MKAYAIVTRQDGAEFAELDVESRVMSSARAFMIYRTREDAECCVDKRANQEIVEVEVELINGDEEEC